jgi:hypothetical protein
VRDRRVGPVHLTRVPSHPPYFQVASTRRVHRVREVQRVTWPRKPAWLAVSFRCHGMSTDAKGSLLANPPPDAELCDICQHPHRTSRVRGTGPVGPGGLAVFDLVEDEP